MRGLAEQIAVLDGLGALDPSDGRIGQAPASVSQYGTAVKPGVLRRTHVIDPSEGGNYSGGSSWAPGLPLLPSNAGLASLPGVLPTLRNVVDPAQGQNYSGGSSWAPGMPLLSSNAGLAAALIEGGYGRAGLGAALIEGGYGRAGLGLTATAADEDLAAAAEVVETVRQLDAGDGRLGQQRPRVDQYAPMVMPGVLRRTHVIDASEGANYSGGSSYAPGLPLLPSTVGLAGLDGLSDDKVGVTPAYKKVAGGDRMAALKMRLAQIQKIAESDPDPARRAKAASVLRDGGQKLGVMRRIRALLALRKARAA